MAEFSQPDDLSDEELANMDNNDIQNIMMKLDRAMMENEKRGRSTDRRTQMRYGRGNALELAQKRNLGLAQKKQVIWDRWYQLHKEKEKGAE